MDSIISPETENVVGVDSILTDKQQTVFVPRDCSANVLRVICKAAALLKLLKVVILM